ncbi:MAG: AAA family ATPase [Trebonia sp.]|uniref:ATP-binding protein n=1 Tax=Trebonia sp. TaxID=2767075 RepID=UPI003BAE583A
MQLLERESSLASLAGYAQEARRGEGRLVLVAGEAGVGKSALVEALECDLPGARWSWGACDGLFTPRPLGPLFDLAAQLGGELLELCRARAGREALFAALLRQVSEPGMLDVVVVEDVHWADEATLDMLRFVGRRIKSAGVLLIATYRDEDLAAGDPLRVVLGELARQRSTRRVELAPLSAGAVRQLAAPAGLDAAELYRLTGGNPFYVTAVIAAGVTEVPAAARDAVLARAVGLSSEGRDVLDAAALTGARAELRLVESVTGCAPPAVEEVLASGLLMLDGAWLRFRHEIARLAAEQAIPPLRRALIHDRVLDALAAAGCDDDARMAFHAEGAGNGPAVVQHASSAARRAAELASHREAAAQFERALRFADERDRLTLAALQEGVAGEYSLLDRWEEAERALRAALQLRRELGDDHSTGEDLQRLCTTLWRLCRGEESGQAAGEAVRVLQALPPGRELACAYANLSTSRMLAGRSDEAVALGEKARALGVELHEADVVSHALTAIGSALLRGGGRDGRGLIERALRIALDADLHEEAGFAYSALHEAATRMHRFDDEQRYFAEGMAYCEDRELGVFSTCLTGWRAYTLMLRGQWDEAADICTRMLGRRRISPVNRLNPLRVLGTIRGRRGEPGAWQLLDEALALAEGVADPTWIVPVGEARAELRWLASDGDLALEEVRSAYGRAAGHVDRWTLAALAIWLPRLGAPLDPPFSLPKPFAAEIAGDWRGAALAWERLGRPYEAALVLQDSTEERRLREAVKIFTGLGASAAARITRQKMRQLGIRSIPAGPRSATRAHPLGLTRREGEVLDLVCAGHTNAQIAAKLFISAKTVDHHVSAVLAKLDAPTRDVAVAHAARLGLVGAAEK